MADDNDDDKPLFELKMGSMSLGRGKSAPELTREQKQELIDERLPKAKLGAIGDQIEAELITPDLLDDYTPEEQVVLKATLAKEYFRVWGDEYSKIEGIVCRDDGSLEAKVDQWFYASIDPEKVLLDYETHQAQLTQSLPQNNSDESQLKDNSHTEVTQPKQNALEPEQLASTEQDVWIRNRAETILDNLRAISNEVLEDINVEEKELLLQKMAENIALLESGTGRYCSYAFQPLSIRYRC